VKTCHAEVTDSSSPVVHCGLKPPRTRHTFLGPLLPFRSVQDVGHRQSGSPVHGNGVLIHHPLLWHVFGVELALILPLIPTAVSSRRMSRLWSSFVSSKESLHNPRSSILVVDSLLSRAICPAHLGWHTLQVELVADPSKGSHCPVQLVLILRAVSPRPSVLTQGLECLACQVGNLCGVVDSSQLAVASSSSFCSTCSAVGNNVAMDSCIS
jgi:hypothetical protein